MSKNERDDFWNLEKLLPKKRQVPLAQFSVKEKVSSVYIKGDIQENREEERLTLTIGEKSLKTTKHLFNNGLVRSVTITKIEDKFDFYGNFRKAALLYYDVKAQKCDFAPFFSYMPQYSQFNTAQKNYYFYWRDMLRRNKFIKTDYSYLYLYVYEILNLPDLIPAEKGLDLLISLWINYREELPSIDSNMTLWIQDYCLIHNLNCPMDKLRPVIFEAISKAEFKEFYLSDVSLMGDDGVRAMLAYLSDYDWAKGRFALGDNREVYHLHLLGAMRLVVSSLLENVKISANSFTETAVLKRSAFRGSLCTHSVKSALEIEYLPLAKLDNFRSGITAAIKYTENKLRALLGVKSRFQVKELPDAYKTLIDEYFTSLFDKANRERRKREAPAYEKLYDAESSGFSTESADEIERASWTTTLRLVEDSEDEIIVVRNEENEIKNENTYGLSLPYVRFIKCLYEKNTEGLKEISGELLVPTEEIINVINEAFSDNFGDVIIEENDGVYSIIEDYKEDIERWLRK